MLWRKHVANCNRLVRDRDKRLWISPAATGIGTRTTAQQCGHSKCQGDYRLRWALEPNQPLIEQLPLRFPREWQVLWGNQQLPGIQLQGIRTIKQNNAPIFAGDFPRSPKGLARIQFLELETRPARFHF
jgi:hypothetical protein